jgi:hypothetical protein
MEVSGHLHVLATTAWSGSYGSSVNIVTRLRDGLPGFNSRQGQ